MKRLPLLVLAVALTVAAPLPAQEHQAAGHETAAAESAHGGEGGAKGGHEVSPVWKWANFALLAVGLGLLIGKFAGPFFASRSEKISKDLVEARRLQEQAEKQAADVNARLANLESEIAVLRSGSQKEAQAETDRIRQQTAAEIAKIQAHAEQEIASAGKAARVELRRYSAELAVGLAGKKIRERMTPGAQETLVDGFIRGLDGPAPRTQGH